MNYRLVADVWKRNQTISLAGIDALFFETFSVIAPRDRRKIARQTNYNMDVEETACWFFLATIKESGTLAL